MDCPAPVMFGHQCRAVRDFLVLMAAAKISSSIVHIGTSSNRDRNWFPFLAMALILFLSLH